MGPTDAAEQIAESAEEIAESAEEIAAERAERRESERFRSRAALMIAILAMLLAITTLAGGNVTDDMINNNIEASDTWAFYQAKNVRQTVNTLTADQMEAELQLQSADVPPAVRREIEKRISKYRATAARYESEPDPEDPGNPLKGEGKKELAARAQHAEAARDHALKQDPNFDYAEALFQIAIVLGSVAILATSRPVLVLATLLGAVATVLMLNGFLLFFPLPF